ncbi:MULTISPECIES: glycosyltransferase family 2 protein [unclassified Frankia]|uniref:glycosyltransferase family 2 protein n=1 Tax=unclassified Frankia TaxID=2632575 RepID=UPI0027DD1982|nr:MULTISPECIES: glycosyltransferase family 2 protein [unclassified Frankia]
MRGTRRSTAVRVAYARCAEACGPLTTPRGDNPRVEFRSVVPPGRRLALALLFLFTALVNLIFVGWLLLPAHVPGAGVAGAGDWRLFLARVSFCLVVLVEVIRIVQVSIIGILAWYARDPVPLVAPPGLRVAVLTTIVPSKEPVSVVARTLGAMREIAYPDGFLTAWILDEENDPEVQRVAEDLGVLHFSRRGRPEYNQPAGEFRARSKAGNHNAWRAEHERHYDVVAQMDPDHVPLTCFLERTLGYFRDPDVAFVVAPQVYGNMLENLVAQGASMQQYLFNGVIERGGNGLDAPLLIGTNHLYRPAAWRQIGGYQDSIIEDHLTSMRVQGTINPATGNPWKGVYTPDVIAIGEAPTTWTDYFNQQKRWAYGVWDVKLRRRAKAGIRLRARQRLLYGMVQFYYPSVATSLLFGSLATVGYLAFGASAVHLRGGSWLTLWMAALGSWVSMWLWLRRFNLAEHERHEIGIPGMVLALFAGPIYLSAAFAAVLRRRLVYAVTAKGELRSTESLRTFRLHLVWAVVAATLLCVNLGVNHRHFAPPQLWALLALLVGLSPPLLSVRRTIAARRRGPADGGPPRTVPPRARMHVAADPMESQLLLTARLAEESSVTENGQ